MNPFGVLPTLISTDRLCNLIRYSEMVKDLEGDVCEFGVFQGGSLEILAKFNAHKTVWGIDSFEGLPISCEKDNFHKQGDFSETSYEDLKGYFAIQHRNVTLLKGFSPDVFNGIHPHKKFCYVHVDVNLYQSVKDAIDFFLPRMVRGGVIIFDDFGFDSTLGAKAAVSEFIEEWGNKKVMSYYGEEKYKNNISHKQYLIIK